MDQVDLGRTGTNRRPVARSGGVTFFACLASMLALASAVGALSFVVGRGYAFEGTPPPGKSAPPDTTNYIRSPISEDIAPKAVTTPAPNRPEGRKRRRARFAYPEPRASPTSDSSTRERTP
jgi:hypothetical protein